MSALLDLFAGGTVGAWAARIASPALVRQVVCLDDEVVASAAERGHEVFAGNPHDAAFAPGGAALAVRFPQRANGGTRHLLAEFEFLRDEGRYEVERAERERLERCLTYPPARVRSSQR